jgi:hypothetical protein
MSKASFQAAVMSKAAIFESAIVEASVPKAAMSVKPAATVVPKAAATVSTMGLFVPIDGMKQRALPGICIGDFNAVRGEIRDGHRRSLSRLRCSGDGQTKQQSRGEDGGFHGLSPLVLRFVASVRKNMTCAAAYLKYRLAVCLIAVGYGQVVGSDPARGRC